jgi:hypothetical protein
MTSIQGLRPVNATELTAVHGGFSLCKFIRAVRDLFKSIFC